MASSSNHESFDHAGKLEANGGSVAQLERLQTAGGHVDDRTQPSLPVVHRTFANPAPLGLLSFATGKHPNNHNMRNLTNYYRYLLDFSIWCPGPRRCYT